MSVFDKIDGIIDEYERVYKEVNEKAHTIFKRNPQKWIKLEDVLEILDKGQDRIDEMYPK